MNRLLYIGEAAIPGVPARDLSEEEAKKHGILRLVRSGLYVDIRPPKRQKAKVGIELPEE